MKTPINNAIAQSDIDFDNRKPANADLSGYAGTNLNWNAVTKKLDVTAGVTQNIFYPESYGAVGDGTTDDTTALQDCIDAAAATGGTVKLSPVTYKITSALSITDAMAIEGSGMLSLYGTVGITGNESVNLPCVSPYLKGSVILQAGAGENGITISVTGLGVDLRDFGIRFADAIKFNNTGHGFFSEGAAYAGKKDSGIASAYWSNLAVYGHDGNHYAFHLTNPIYGTFDHLTAWGGGGILVEANWNVCCSGNITFVNPYFSTCAGGTAHGFHIKNDSGNTSAILMTFIRPQCNTVNLSDIGITPVATNAQNTFRLDPDPGDGHSPWLTILSPDFETTVGSTTSGIYGRSTVTITNGIVDADFNHWAEWNSPVKINDTLTTKAIALISMADSAAANSTMYFSTDAGKPVFKDSGGVVHALY